MERTRPVPAHATESARLLDGSGRDQRRAGDEPSALEDPHLAERRAATNREGHVGGSDDPLDERHADTL